MCDTDARCKSEEGSFFRIAVRTCKEIVIGVQKKKKILQKIRFGIATICGDKINYLGGKIY